MSLLRLAGVRREIGTLVILDSVSAAIAQGEHIGLVGVNGAGKTSLLRVMAGIDELDGGEVLRKRSLRVDMLVQEANLDERFVTAPTLRAAVRAGAQRLEELEGRLHGLEAAGPAGVQSPEYARLRDEFEAHGGYELDVRVEAALSGLGFAPGELDRPPTQLSGGQQTRAALARVLVADAELLLLDEPTNHLDVAAIEWLEAALAARHGAIVVASHDRAFLDGVAGRVWELRERRLEIFRGNYSAYLAQREERDARRRKEMDTRQGQIEREQELVGRYRSHRKFSKMHEHERRLEALQAEAVDVRPVGRRPAMALGGNGKSVTRHGDVAVSLEDLVCGYDSAPVVSVARLEARRAARIGLVGPNGSGKTTLLRTLAGELAPLSGYLRLGSGVHVAYLAQIRRAPLPGTTVLEALMNGSGLDAGPARSYLARLLFRGDDVLKEVNVLSGGERSRLELALAGVGSANLLLLDEPTNHLDIPAREALETFLRETPATVVVVSHDRRLLEGVCEEMWVVGEAAAGSTGGRSAVVRFDSGYRDWRAALAEGWSVADVAVRTSARSRLYPGPHGHRATHDQVPATPPRRHTGQRAVRLSKDAYQRRKRVVEDDLTRLGLRKSQLELALGDPSIQANFVELRRVSSELADVDAALAQAEDAWLVLAEQAPRR
jgi:ATP-binding cassette subfamily F protein 3